VNRREFLELSAGHALHALSAEEEQRFAAALAAHPEWADETRADLEAATRLGAAVGPVPPAPDVREHLLARIGPPDAEERRAEAATGRAGGTPSARRGWFALAASLIVLLVLGGVGAIVASQHVGGSPSDPALAQIQRQPDARTATQKVAGGGTLTAHWSGTLGKAVVVSQGIPSLPRDRVYELWYVREGTALPAGPFAPPDGNATTPLEGRMRAGDTIAVTIEPDGGSPTRAPTTAPIVTIPTA
jgi:anti-sigma-K factor RskA